MCTSHLDPSSAFFCVLLSYVVRGFAMVRPFFQRVLPSLQWLNTFRINSLSELLRYHGKWMITKRFWTSETVNPLDWYIYIYSRVSFCDGSFYDDSILRPLPSQTEHSRLAVHQLSQLKRPVSTQCTSRSFLVCMCLLYFYFSAVLLRWLWFFHAWRPSKWQLESYVISTLAGNAAVQ